MKNALIIGVTGQDGAYLADFLLKKGYNVFGTFRRTSHRCFERLDEMNNYENIIRNIDQYLIIDADIKLPLRTGRLHPGL